MSSTKIVATIGPVTASPEGIAGLAKAGMNIARLNGSHADLDWHAKTIAMIRETVPHVPILFDIPGKKIRTLQLAHEPTFNTGDEIILTTDTSHDGTEKVPVNNATLHEFMREGATVFADDGTLRLTVTRVSGRDIICRAENAGTLRSRKGINVPYVKLAAELVTDRDRKMVGFARDNGIDYIGISFVESAHHIQAIRELTGGDWPRIVAKIENQGGLDNMDEILATTDAAMIDRGDLSVETNLENISVFQKRIIERARHHGRPVIVATEILHTMIDNPFPTKAEVSDISNAVLDGCAATMLSGETAVGANPFEAVGVMRNVVTAAEIYEQSILDEGRDNDALNADQALEDAAALICRSLSITKIVAVTLTGYAARVLAARRPRQPIIAISSDPMAARSFNLLPGTEGLHVDIEFSASSTDHIAECLEICWRVGKIDDNDFIFVTAVGYPRPGNTMNLLQTHHVRDLITSMGWKR
jgi:pyruvate kinase